MSLLDTPERSALASAAEKACASDTPWPRLLDLGLADLAHAVGEPWTTEIAIIATAYGAAATASPFAGRVIAARALAAAAPIADGRHALGTTVTPDIWLTGGRLDTRHSNGQWRVSGTIDMVLDLDGAERVLLVDAGRLFTVDLTDAVVTPAPSLDPGTSLGRVRLDDSPLLLVADVGDWDRDAVRAQACVLLSAIAAGAAQALVDDVVQFAGERFQFGRAIGSFQAVRHRVVDMTLAVDRSRTALVEATAQLERDDPDAQLYTAMAALTCTNVYERVAADAIQVYGGIGFTWDHPAHRHLKRARLLAELCGPRHRLLTDVADAVGLPV